MRRTRPVGHLGRLVELGELAESRVDVVGIRRQQAGVLLRDKCLEQSGIDLHERLQVPDPRHRLDEKSSL